MKPNFYLDLHIVGEHVPWAAARVMRVLHRVFAQNPGTYALALPGYGGGGVFHCLRVFAATPQALAACLPALAQSPEVLPGMLQMGTVQAVPADFSGQWHSYRRYRIPSRKAERKPDGQLRQRRMQQADAARLPYFLFKSQSTGQAFSLYIERHPGEPGSLGEPDSYGLARANAPFALPHLP